MEIIYNHSESTIKPKTIEHSKHTVWLRKDIIEVISTDTLEDGTVINTTVYEYKEAKLTHSEFAEYATQIASLNAIKGINDSENISKIVQNGVDNEDNQLILMEAMADLYDLLANLM